MNLPIILLLGFSHFLSVSTTIRSGTRLIDGIFTAPTLNTGYHLIATIPIGATDLNVTELRRTNNFLALRSQNDGYLFNGNYSINWSGIYKAAGTKFVYRRQSRRHLESVTAVGPLVEPIDVMLLYQEPNSGIVYRYHEPVVVTSKRVKNNSGTTMPSDEASASSEADLAPSSFNKRYRNKRKFVWRASESSGCSTTCGGGIESTTFVCVREHTSAQVSSKRCHGLEKPFVERARCNTAPCPPKWRLGSWTECSVTCGIGVRTRRESECVQRIDESLIVRVADEACSSERPLPVGGDETCVMTDCEDERLSIRARETATTDDVAASSPWQVGQWSECSAYCGHGERTRSVTCKGTDDVCSTSTKPTSKEPCDTTSDCPGDAGRYDSTAMMTRAPVQSRWLHTEWSHQCSSECGTGIETRRVTCFTDERENNNDRRYDDRYNRCPEDIRPESVRNCSSEKSCGTGQWFAGPWSQCSVSCDSGEQTRSTVCVTIFRGVSKIIPDVGCPSVKPETRKACDNAPCGSFYWYTSSWSQCTRSCGTGAQTRDVRCLDDSGINSYDRFARHCNETERPTSTRICNDHPCKATMGLRNGEGSMRSRYIETSEDTTNELYGDEICKDDRANCVLVTQARLCTYPYYRTICCASCLKWKGEQFK